MGGEGAKGEGLGVDGAGPFGGECFGEFGAAAPFGDLSVGLVEFGLLTRQGAGGVVLSPWGVVGGRVGRGWSCGASRGHSGGAEGIEGDVPLAGGVFPGSGGFQGG